MWTVVGEVLWRVGSGDVVWAEIWRIKLCQPCKEAKKEPREQQMQRPEVGMSLASWRKRREAGMAWVGWTRVRLWGRDLWALDLLPETCAFLHPWECLKRRAMECWLQHLGRGVEGTKGLAHASALTDLLKALSQGLQARMKRPFAPWLASLTSSQECGSHCFLVSNVA